jgi:catechol 2,3-dioxygenase-like lactoylglutathione lyase family enzyme
MKPVMKWHHSSLAVRDVKVSGHFYKNVFGFREIFSVDNMQKEIASITGVEKLRCDLVQLGHADTSHVLELIAFHNESELPKHPIQTGMAHLSFIVPSLEAALEHIKQHDGHVLGEVTVFSEGKAVYVREPGGSFIELEEMFER